MESPTSLAPRRSKRRAAEAISPIKSSAPPATEPSATTPTKRRSKRVRFSTGSTLNHLNVNNLPPGTTGLTPAVSKHRLATPKSRRRVSTPAPSRSISMPVVLPPSSPIVEGEVQFTPLRQALDGRMQRRIKRNHMSEEFEDYEREKKEVKDLRKQIESKDAELKKLKTQVAENDKERGAPALSPIQETAVSKQVDERIVDIEAELSLLRRSFQEFDQPEQVNDDQDDGGIVGGGDDWNDIPRSTSSGPHSESGDTIRIFEDDPSVSYPSTTRLPSIADTQDAATMGLELESARQAKKSFLQSSFTRRSLDASDLHFEDSPSKPTAHISSPMPKVNPGILSTLAKQLKAANARAEDAELALEALEGEVRALSSGFTTSDTAAHTGLNALADHFRHVRLELERLFPGEITLGLDATHYHALLPALINKLKSVMHQLQTTNLEYTNLRTQERTLRNNFDSAADAHRTAQQKIDTLQRKTEDLEKTLDEYTQTLLDERTRANSAEKAAQEHLSDNTKLKTALDAYRADLTRLESLISTMEAAHAATLSEIHTTHTTTTSDLQAQISAETTGRRAAESSAVSRLRTIQVLEEKLTSAKEHSLEIERSLTSDVSGLTTRLSSVSNALAATEAESARLRKLLAKCEKRYREEVYRGETAVAEMREEVLKVAARVSGVSKGFRRKSRVGLANWELESSDPVVEPMEEDGDGDGELPMTPSSSGDRGVRFARYSEVRDLVGSSSDQEDGEADQDDDEEGDEEQGSSDREQHDEDHEDEESVPGSVEVARGKKKSVLLTPQMTVSSLKGMGSKIKLRRKYDSGIGIDEDDNDDEGEGQGEEDSGLASPELSSEADVDGRMEAMMGGIEQPAF